MALCILKFTGKLVRLKTGKNGDATPCAWWLISSFHDAYTTHDLGTAQQDNSGHTRIHGQSLHDSPFSNHLSPDGESRVFRFI